MSAAAFPFACAAVCCGLLSCAALDRRAAMRSARMRRVLALDAARQGALALAFTGAACALAFA